MDPLTAPEENTFCQVFWICICVRTGCVYNCQSSEHDYPHPLNPIHRGAPVHTFLEMYETGGEQGGLFPVFTLLGNPERHGLTQCLHV